MVMVNYTRSEPSIRTVTETYHGVTTVSSFPDVKGTRQLLGVITRRGDRKNPNPHAYVKFRTDALDFKSTSDDTKRGGSLIVHSGKVLVENGPTVIPDDHPSSLKVSDYTGRLTDDSMEKVYKKIRGKANLAVDLAESRETMAMLRNFKEVGRRLLLYNRNPSALVLDVANTLKGGPRKWPTKVIRTASNQWMQYRYGIMPLIYSTYDILDTMYRANYGGTIRVIGRATDSDGSEASMYDSASNCDVSISESLSVRVQNICFFALPSGNQIYDYTSLSPLGIAWELLPLSFVGDWFVNVGQVLDLMENKAIFANRLISRVETVTTRRTSVSVFKLRTAAGQPVYSSEGGRVTRITSLARSISETLPSPQFPSVQVKLNSKRFLDAAALIYQRSRLK